MASGYANRSFHPTSEKFQGFRWSIRSLAAALLIISCRQCTNVSDPSSLFQEGENLLNTGDTVRAYSAFAKAADRCSDNASYQWAAASIAPDRNKQYIHTVHAWDAGRKTVSVFRSYLATSFHTTRNEKLQFAFSLYDELPDTIQTQALKGEVFAVLGYHDSALSCWKSDLPNNPRLVYDVAVAYQHLGHLDSAVSLLTKYKDKDRLGIEGYSLLAGLLSLDYRFDDAVELYAELENRGKGGDEVRLEHAGILAAQRSFPAALRILYSLLESDDESIKARASLVAATIFEQTRNRIELLKLAEKCPVSIRKLLLSVVSPSDKTNLDLEGNPQGLLRFPHALLLQVEILSTTGQHQAAVDLYRLIPGYLLSSPLLCPGYAEELSHTGREDLALVVLGHMHEHGVSTRESLILFRDICLRNGFLQKGYQAQRALEALTVMEPESGIAGVMVRLRLGKLREALKLSQDLIDRFPEHSPARATKVNVLYRMKEYRKVVEYAESLWLTHPSVAVILANSLDYEGNHARAREIFELSIQKHASHRAGIQLERASYLVSRGKHAEASSLFEKILNHDKEALKKDEVKNAFILNNYAWSRFQEGVAPENGPLQAAKSAHELLPHDPNILDTYATLLNGAGQYERCIQTLVNSRHTAREPRLLLHLAKGYKALGLSNRATETVRELKKCNASECLLPISINKGTADSLLMSVTDHRKHGRF